MTITFSVMLVNKIRLILFLLLVSSLLLDFSFCCRILSMETLCSLCRENAPVFRDKKSGEVFCSEAHYLQYGTREGGPERTAMEQPRQHQVAYFGKVKVSDWIVGCDVGFVTDAELTPYLAKLFNIIAGLNDHNKRSSIEVPFINTKWQYNEEFAFLSDMEFTSKISYRSEVERKPVVVHVMDNLSVIARAYTLALFYNLVVAFQQEVNELVRESYEKRVGAALIALTKAIFVEKRYYGNIYPTHVLSNNRSPSTYLEFDDDSDDYKHSNSDSDTEEDGDDDEIKGISVEKKTVSRMKDDAALYYGKWGTAYFMYIDVLRDNKLLDEIVKQLLKQNYGHTHHLRLLSIKRYVKKTLFIESNKVTTTTATPKITLIDKKAKKTSENSKATPPKKHGKGGKKVDKKVDTKWNESYFVSTPSYNATWDALITEYESTVDKTEGDSTMSNKLLDSVPFVNDLQDKSKVSIVVTYDTDKVVERIDAGEETDDALKRIAGYVTCKLVTINKMPAEPTGIWPEPNISAFVRSDPLSGDRLFHVYHINGLHVSPLVRNNGLARLLIYYALLFIKRARSQLGVTLITCEAAAYPTRLILEEFGFTFYNESMSLYWIHSALTERYEMQDKGGRRPATPGQIHGRIMSHIRLYDHEHNECHDEYNFLKHSSIKLLSTKNESDKLQEFEVHGLGESIRKIRRVIQDKEESRDTKYFPGDKRVDVRGYVNELVADMPVSDITCSLFLRDDDVNQVFREKMKDMSRRVLAGGDKTSNIRKADALDETDPNKKKKIGVSFTASHIESFATDFFS